MRLIDADALLEVVKADRFTYANEVIYHIINAPTIQREAIAYMQEQNKSAEQSEPVATIYNGNAYWIGKEPPEGTNLFTTPQRQQPLKRLDAEQLEILWMNVVDSLPECSPEMAFANAIMDKMQELNK